MDCYIMRAYHITSEYLTEASIMALMFGHANDYVLGFLFLLFI